MMPHQTQISSELHRTSKLSPIEKPACKRTRESPHKERAEQNKKQKNPTHHDRVATSKTKTLELEPPKNVKTNPTKLKPKSPKTKQPTIKTYWLSNPTPSQPDINNTNRFQILDNEDLNPTEVHNEKENTESMKSHKPPPIFVQNVENINILSKALSTLEDNAYQLRVINNTEIKIQPTESRDYTTIIKILNAKETQYYT